MKGDIMIYAIAAVLYCASALAFVLALTRAAAWHDFVLERRDNELSAESGGAVPGPAAPALALAATDARV